MKPDANQMILIAVPTARSGRAELVDHARAGRRRGRGSKFKSWKEAQQQPAVEVLIDGESPQASVLAKVVSHGPDWSAEGREAGTLITLRMPDCSDSLNEFLPRRMSGVRLESLRRVKETK